MNAILIKSRYKVTQVLYADGGAGYASLLAVDIVSRDKTEYLINVYEGALGRRYAGIYERLQHCPEYAGAFLSDGALVAVFTYKRAQDIDDVFYKGATAEWKTRVHYAQLLFHLALSVSDFPPEISCAAFLSGNLKILRNDMKLAVNYMVSPIAEASRRELIYMLSDNILKVLPHRFYMPSDELEFVKTLESGAFTSVAALYSAWQDVMARITAEYERVYNMNAFRRALHFLSARLSRSSKKKRKRARDSTG